MSRTPKDPSTEAVESYLTFLKNPDALVNRELVSTLKERMSETSSPLEQLQLLSALHSAESVDESSIIESFVKNAAEYARREKIVPEAFIQFGVPTDVLRAAGLLPGGGPKKAARSSKTVKSAATRTGSVGRPGTGRVAVLAAIPSSPFTIKELESLSGVSTVTVRKVVEDLVNSGELFVCAPDGTNTGRGPAPRRYTKGPGSRVVAAAAPRSGIVKRVKPGRKATKRS